MARKGLVEGIPTNPPYLEEPFPISILTKATKIPIYPTIDVSNNPPWFMLHMDFFFFNVESIHGFTSTFVNTHSYTSYSFGFTSRSKNLPLGILKCIVTTLSNQDKKVSLIQFDEDGALEISSEFMKTYHNINIIVQTIGGYSYSLTGKSEIPNNTLANITRAILLNSIHKKELW